MNINIYIYIDINVYLYTYIFIYIYKYTYIELSTMEEAFTSEHWIVRIFKVKKRPNLDPTGTYIIHHTSCNMNHIPHIINHKPYII
jgi:hypothetical protein